MYRRVVGVAALIAAFVFQHCTDSTSPSTPSVELYSEVSSSTVRQAIQSGKGNTATGITLVDSIKIDRVRILVRRLKLHPSEDDSSGKDIKTEPFIVTFTSQQQLVTSATIPSGTYRWMKLEFHRLSNEEADRFYSNPAFADFIPPERYSVIIDGRVYSRGNIQPDTFTYRSTVTANVPLKLDPPMEVNESTILRLVLRFDPAAVFTTSAGIVLHPLDPDNRSLIEGNIRVSLKALKR